MVYGDYEMKRTVNTLRSAIAILLALIVLIPAAACKDKNRCRKQTENVGAGR